MKRAKASWTGGTEKKNRSNVTGVSERETSETRSAKGIK